MFSYYISIYLSIYQSWEFLLCREASCSQFGERVRPRNYQEEVEGAKGALWPQLKRFFFFFFFFFLFLPFPLCKTSFRAAGRKRIDRWWVRVHSFAHPNKTSNIANTTRQQLDVHTTQDANYQLSRAARFQCSFDMHHETMMMAVLDGCLHHG